MDTCNESLSRTVTEILQSSVHDAHVDLIRMLFNLAVSLLRRRLCSTVALEPADDFHGSHLWKPHFASMERSFELVRVCETAEFENGGFLDVQDQLAGAIPNRYREPQTFAIAGPYVAAGRRRLYTNPIQLPERLLGFVE